MFLHLCFLQNNFSGIAYKSFKRTTTLSCTYLPFQRTDRTRKLNQNNISISTRNNQLQPERNFFLIFRQLIVGFATINSKLQFVAQRRTLMDFCIVGMMFSILYLAYAGYCRGKAMAAGISLPTCLCTLADVLAATLPLYANDLNVF